MQGQEHNMNCINSQHMEMVTDTAVNVSTVKTVSIRMNVNTISFMNIDRIMSVHDWWTVLSVPGRESGLIKVTGCGAEKNRK